MLVSRRSTLLGLATAGALTLTHRPAQAASLTWKPIRGLAQGRAYAVMGPKRSARRRPIAIFHHGYGGTVEALRTSSATAGQRKVIEALARAGYMVLVSDFGGNQWGNDRNHRYISQLIEAGRQLGGRGGKVVLVGCSMGGAAVLSYAGRYPARVACVIPLIPALDLMDFKQYGPMFVDAAYNGNYKDEVYGRDHNPVIMARTPHRLTPTRPATSQFSAMPIAIWYAKYDAVTKPHFVQTFVGRVRAHYNPRVETHALEGTHTDSVVGTIPMARLTGFAKRHLPV